MQSELKNKNMVVKAGMLIVLFLCLVNESEQQFSYSANWGKRSSQTAPDVTIGYNALRDLVEFDSQVRIFEENLKQLCSQQKFLKNLAIVSESSQSSTSASGKLNQKLFENALNDIYSNTIFGRHFKTLCPEEDDS